MISVVDKIKCKTKQIPIKNVLFLTKVNGGWSAYGNYSACSRSCGGGVQIRIRSCNNPAPTHGGTDCVGSATQPEFCNFQPCPGNI